MDLVFRLTYNPFMWKHSAKYAYPMQTRRVETDDVVFLNAGYQESPPLDLPLDPADEPNRPSIQLYHRTATQADITGRRVLEVGCGHGGGASYLTRYLRPASYTGLDLNGRGIAYCRRMHQLPGLDFVQGNAQNLPFPAESFDAVINVESAHCYPSFPGFLREVARVLVSGGHFLYTDLRNRKHVDEWEAQLAEAPLTLLSGRSVNAEILRGLDQMWSSAATHERFNRHTPRLLRRVTKGVAGAPGPGLHRAVRDGDIAYRMYDFVKP
ncbi:SAM-dependent methyltransferase [Mycobacterium sp. IS-1742]|uniref:phthiotriol/phenolphthiotriol dimycocerosates methyltransferase n=1 Tax=Mycobacterium sp. IS-1742 TaxID=1772285 RepID=UPI0007403CCC|nr:class I SAM-dependent methyltransferase [Mycobacterium sp. IS-1742]KUI30913.1 SAM-dependent methyltransferase [Mycobacterium sp. IS-1742]